ncbi:hypothetical protein EPO15_15615 [bacterium]|nr:MAG: hypothetical protein EPO15_15615 [bacterium]
MDVSGLYNLCEVLLWGTAAAVMFVRSSREEGPMRRLGKKTSAVLAVFSLTDVIEIKTGAWWDPWWLLTLKSACVVALVGAGIRYRKLRSQG